MASTWHGDAGGFPARQALHTAVWGYRAQGSGPRYQSKESRPVGVSSYIGLTKTKTKTKTITKTTTKTTTAIPMTTKTT